MVVVTRLSSLHMFCSCLVGPTINIVLPIEINEPRVYGTANFAGAIKISGIAGVESSQKKDPIPAPGASKCRLHDLQISGKMQRLVQWSLP